ncbi:MAG: CRISPR-associated endonuclease Cas1 [Chloroflexi bacterium]|nr:CRISPR-associated endonuclease Cas1 [Chloroflexota bacterium]
MTTLYVTEDRAFVRKEGRTLLVRRSADQTVRIPLEQVTEVICCGDVSFSGAALRELSADGIGVGYIGPRGEWVGRWEPAEAKTIPLRRAQFRAADDPALTLAIARPMVAGKLRNTRALLLRARREGAAVGDDVLAALEALRGQAATAPTLDSLRGVEGDGAARYFPAFGAIVSVNGFAFRQRQRRPPPDPVNAMLSFGYALLTGVATTAARTVGFDPHLGYLHAMRYGRESLALDLIEEFRPIVVDALVVALIRLKMIAPNDFDRTPTECRLNAQARKVFLTQFERKLDSVLHHPVLDRQVSHRRAIELQARLLAKFLLGEVPAYVSFSKR